MRRTGTTTRIYKDGVDVTTASATQTFTDTTSNLDIGDSLQWPTLLFDGSLDEVAIYTERPLGSSRSGPPRPLPRAATLSRVSLDGSILRVDPVTGAALPGNPYARKPRPEHSPDHRVRPAEPIPHRHPPRHERTLGRGRGWNTWEEIDRITTRRRTVENFGWPCYEGSGPHPATTPQTSRSANRSTSRRVTAPAYTYSHGAKRRQRRRLSDRQFVVTGITFYPEAGGNVPRRVRGRRLLRGPLP